MLKNYGNGDIHHQIWTFANINPRNMINIHFVLVWQNKAILSIFQHFNENLLPSENMSIQFWRQLNEMKLENVKKSHHTLTNDCEHLKLKHTSNGKTFLKTSFIILLPVSISLIFFVAVNFPLKISYNINYVIRE